MARVSQTELIAGAIAGKVVSFPTDTVPALAVKPEWGNAIYQLKQRERDKPLILLGAALPDLLPYISYSSEELKLWQDLAARYFPGALTLVLPASSLVPEAINHTSSQTVGIRVPNSEIARAILSRTGVMATSSANISGQTTLQTLNAIAQTFPEVLVLQDSQVPDAQPIGSGRPSTVVGWQNKTWQLLRQGSVRLENLPTLIK